MRFATILPNTMVPLSFRSIFYLKFRGRMGEEIKNIRVLSVGDLFRRWHASAPIASQ